MADSSHGYRHPDESYDADRDEPARRRLDGSGSQPSFENPFRPESRPDRNDEGGAQARTVDESVFRSLYDDADEDEQTSSDYEAYARAAFGDEDDEDEGAYGAKPVSFDEMNHASQLLDDEIDIDGWDEDLSDDEPIEDADEDDIDDGDDDDDGDGDGDDDDDDGGDGDGDGDDDDVDIDDDDNDGEEEDIDDDGDGEEEDVDDDDYAETVAYDEDETWDDADASTGPTIHPVTDSDTTGELPVVDEEMQDTREFSSVQASAMPYAELDYEREERCGFPEVIFGAGKTAKQIIGISEALLEEHGIAYTTRVRDESVEALVSHFDDGTWLPSCHLFFVDRREGGAYGANVEEVLTSRPAFDLEGHIVVCCAGTSDLPVAEEAAITAYLMGSKVTLLNDIGVAGIHRTLSHTELLRSARAIVAVAGMEGALPSVLAGLVDVPVVAVPTSVGYGASLGGLAALLGMLSSCANGVCVVNIDNGFGAGNVADRINRPPIRFLDA